MKWLQLEEMSPKLCKAFRKLPKMYLVSTMLERNYQYFICVFAWEIHQEMDTKHV